MPKALSIANAMSSKSRLSISRSLIAWLSGLMFSRGMSQVSAMISATLSNVVDIRHALYVTVWIGADCKRRSEQPDRPSGPPGSNAPYSEGWGQVQRRMTKVQGIARRLRGGDKLLRSLTDLPWSGDRLPPCSMPQKTPPSAGTACSARTMAEWEEYDALLARARRIRVCCRRTAALVRRSTGPDAARCVAQYGARHRRDGRQRMREGRQQCLGGGGRPCRAPPRLPPG